jgi:hypothetical protein
VKTRAGGLADSINTYLAAHPPRDLTLVTIGRERLSVAK